MMCSSGAVLTLSLTLLFYIRLVVCQEDHMWSVTGVAGRASDLPCYLNPRTPGDRPKLILWYKRGIRTPVFSHDGRVPQMRSDMNQNGGTLTVSRGAATLTLHNLSLAHGGVYECRVDFFKSPTHTNFVNLTVVESPSSVEVVDGRGGHARGGVLGPYLEDSPLSLTCIAKGGSPLPNVTWWREDRLLSEKWHLKAPNQVENELWVEKLTREWINTSLTCVAANTHLANPVSVTVKVDMYLLPTSVIVINPGPAREGEKMRLLCTSTGSRPSANLTWTVRGVTRSAQKENMVYGKMTSSTLITNLTREDHNTTVTCSATNPAAPDQPLANSTSLIVHYPPTVNASLGRSLRPELLKEGDDVYFTCSVAANPPATSITWYHKGTPLVQNVSGGIILSGNSLVLQGVGRQQVGRYTCSAINPLSSATSSPVTLRIKYKPVCRTSPTTYFIYDKPINVTCSVSSYPPVKAIQWQWNSSNDVLSTVITGEEEDDDEDDEEPRVWAQLTVEPTQSREDRTLTCWAVNEMGKQTTPCGFSVKVAQTPLPLSSCRLANITASSLSLTCQRPDVDAVGTTHYRAEVYFENRTLFANVTSERPNFNVSSLDAGTSYQIKVYVTHGPVTSQPVVVSAYTSRTSRTPSDSRGGGTSVGKVLGGLLLLLLIVVAGAWIRHLRRRRTVAAGERKKHEVKVPSDETNPDVVPTAVEDTFDLLSAGAAKSEVPILTPVYEAVAATLSEGMVRKSMASAEVYPAVRGAGEGAGHRRTASRDADVALLQHQKGSIENLQDVRQKGSPGSFPRVRLQEEAVDFSGSRMDPRMGPDDFPRVRLHHSPEPSDYMERSHRQSETPEDFSRPRHIEATSPEDYSTVRLPSRTSEEYREEGRREELYCPVDQLMQAAETVV
ncbi:hemicentin-1-like [Portunus trituberculatus]|uniref:hemicentin-1-like n=1 Tax=Portunus trituberculatus TaxID=210409 RepID=UPI001E1D2133|nr:hemicentin-1-like [Portunus trituberculatus]XP_045127166.1 hemicentin-1-like [Portunus trituberculatus]XP_045127167.1 hemicentin-1-like [Portunus trituberculatus]